MSNRGGKRAGAGRPPRDDAYGNAYEVWSYVQQHTSENGVLKNAKLDAEREFGVCKTTITRNLEYVGKVFEVLKLAQDNNPEKFNELVGRLHARGWFTDEA